MSAHLVRVAAVLASVMIRCMADHLVRFRTRGWVIARRSMIFVALGSSGLALADLISDGPSPFRLVRLVFWALAAVLYSHIFRRETRLTPSGIVIHTGTLRPRAMSNDEILGVHRRTSYSPVRVELVDGESIELPGVRPEDFEAVKSHLIQRGAVAADPSPN